MNNMGCHGGGGRGGSRGSGGSKNSYSFPTKSEYGKDEGNFSVSINNLKEEGIDSGSLSGSTVNDSIQKKMDNLGIDVTVNVPKYQAASERQLDYANKLAEKAVMVEANNILSIIKKKDSNGSSLLQSQGAKDRGIKTAQDFANFRMQNSPLIKTVLNSKTAGEVIDSLKSNRAVDNFELVKSSPLAKKIKSTR